jgi:uncharacterized protein (DUF58 family)
LRRPVAMQVRVARTLGAARVSPGAPVTVTLTLTNDGAQIDELRVEDVVPAGLRVVDGDATALAALPAGGELALQYTVQGQRGEFVFRDARLSANDGFGLFHTQGVASALATLLVRPNVRPLRPIALRPPRTRGFAGPIPARQGGSGVDFFGLREYQVGDRLRWMNWRASARHERALYSNEFEQERITDIGVILDARQQTDVRAGDDSLFNHATLAAASLAAMFLNQGNRVGLLVYGRGREGVFPGYGHAQRERIFRALGRSAAGHNYALESLNHLPARFFPPGSQIVFISGLGGTDDVAVLTRMRARGYAVMVVSPNPIDYETRALGANAAAPAAQSARRIAQVERDLAVHALRRVGVQVVDWRVDQPLDATLHESLARQPVSARALPGGGITA